MKKHNGEELIEMLTSKKHAAEIRIYGEDKRPKSVISTYGGVVVDPFGSKTKLTYINQNGQLETYITDEPVKVRILELFSEDLELPKQENKKEE